MMSCDFFAYAYDGAVYCIECLPDDIDPKDYDVSPIFADSCWDYYPTCDVCGHQHDYVDLTNEGLVHKDIQAILDQFGHEYSIEAKFAFAAWCQDHHTGQWSYEYSVSTILQVDFGPLGSNWIHREDSIEKAIYTWLCEDRGCLDHDTEDTEDTWEE